MTMKYKFRDEVVVAFKALQFQQESVFIQVE